MKGLQKILSYIGLTLVAVPPFLVFKEIINLELYKDLLLAGTLIWLFNAPFWINEKKKLNNKA